MVVRSAGVLARMKAHQKAQLVRLLSKGLQVSDDCHLKVICCRKTLLLSVLLLLLPPPASSSPSCFLFLLLPFAPLPSPPLPFPSLPFPSLPFPSLPFPPSWPSLQPVAVVMGDMSGSAAPHAADSACLYSVVDPQHQRHAAQSACLFSVEDRQHQRHAADSACLYSVVDWQHQPGCSGETRLVLRVPSSS